jgi:hypothetical protein
MIVSTSAAVPRYVSSTLTKGKTMAHVISIFDFDQTVTIKHTFYRFALVTYPDSGSQLSHYEAGRANAEQNMKQGVRERLKHNLEHLSAIATYHNNPAFIAGFIARILGNELKFNKTVFSDVSPRTAIDYYSVEGIETPFLISYIPAANDEFDKTLAQLHGKNEQLTHLKQIFLTEKWIPDNSVINYYDDSYVNFQCAIPLSLINRHYVDPVMSEFTILATVECELAAERNDDDSEFVAANGNDSSPVMMTPISTGFFMQVISSEAAEVIGGLLLIAGLAALIAGTLGVAGAIAGFAGVAAIATAAGGAVAAVVGAGMLRHSIFSAGDLSTAWFKCWGEEDASLDDITNPISANV